MLVRAHEHALTGTNDATAAGGDAYDPYGFCYKGLNQDSTGSCKCTAAGVPYCSTGAGIGTGLGGGVNDPGINYTPNCFCRSRWILPHMIICRVHLSDLRFEMSSHPSTVP
jgi:hypothetical protein